MAVRLTCTDNASGHDGLRWRMGPDAQSVDIVVGETAPGVGELLVNDPIEPEACFSVAAYAGSDESATAEACALTAEQIEILSFDPAFNQSIDYLESNTIADYIGLDGWQMAYGEQETNVATGKIYFEVEVLRMGPNMAVGISSITTQHFPGVSDDGGFSYLANGRVYRGIASYITLTSGTYLQGDILGFEVDFDEPRAYFYKNNVYIGSSVFSVGGGSPFFAVSIFDDGAAKCLLTEDTMIYGPPNPGYSTFGGQ